METLFSHPGRGWIEVICGPMFSGKSEELIRRADRAQIAKQKLQTFKHSSDDRYDKEMIASHSGATLEASPVDTAQDILEAVRNDTQVVVIDEAQFFDKALVQVCRELADSGKRVVVAGLDQDFRGESFGPVGGLMIEAEFVTKLLAICVKCGGPALRSQRLIDGRPAPWDDSQIRVGAAETYEARCRRCHEIRRPDS